MELCYSRVEDGRNRRRFNATAALAAQRNGKHMESLTDIITHLGVWNWLILGCILLALEIVVPGVHFLWFGLAALIAGALMMILGALAPDFAATIDWPVQLIGYALISTAIVFAVRRYASPSDAPSDQPDLNARSAQYVGRTFVVAVAITGGRGKAHVGDTLWVVKGKDAPKGASVRVTGFEGPVLIVERAV